MITLTCLIRITRATNVRYASKYSVLKHINAIESGNGYDVLKLNRAPVNSLNTEFCGEVIQAVDIAETSKETRGLIITSDLKVFSAGLDLLEMYSSNENRLISFWKNVQEMALRLYSSPLVIHSAINGPCPAGGCIFAFSSDYRLMSSGKHVMGLNETRLGIAAPFWLAEMFKLVIGHREAERMLALGEMVGPDECLAKGIVDKVVSPETLLETAEKDMKDWLSIPEMGRIQTKMHVRKHFLDEFHTRREEDLNVFTKSVQHPKIQKILGIYLESLKKKK